MFLFHFYIYFDLDASLTFGERRHTSFFFKYGFSSIFISFIFSILKIILLYFPSLVSFVSIPFFIVFAFLFYFWFMFVSSFYFFYSLFCLSSFFSIFMYLFIYFLF